jgi:hypothetical protein
MSSNKEPNMDHRDREAIEDLFRRLREVEGRIPRDREAEAFIQQRIAEHPSSPYYMAQTIIVQQQALEQAEARLAELEGGRPRRRGQRGTGYEPGPWGVPAYGGGGFLAGAAQTALGVAGGVLLGSMIAGAFAGDAEAAEADQGDEGDQGGDGGDFGGDGGGDFGGGDF